MELTELYESLSRLAKQYGAERLVLFGSRARGDGYETSDIDLAVYGMPEENRAAFHLAVEELPTLLKFDMVHISPATEKALLANIERDGVTLCMNKMENFQRAVRRLEEGAETFSQNPTDDLYCSGLIQRFEFTVELAWKSMREYLEQQGFVFKQIFPKTVIKEAYAAGLITDQRLWLAIIDARNTTSHLYSETAAVEIARKICTEFLPVFQALAREYLKE